MKTLKAVILADLYPSSYLDPSTKKPSGLSVDVFNLLARETGYEVEWTSVTTWDQIEQLLQEGRVDLCPIMAITADRSHRYLFTSPIETATISLVIRSQTRDLNNLEDLHGRTAVVMRGSQARATLLEHPEIRVQECETFHDGLFNLLAGKVDAFVGPAELIASLLRQLGLEQGRVRFLQPPLLELKRSIAVRRDLPQVHARLEDALLNLGDAHRELWTKWYGQERPWWQRAPRWLLALVGSLLVLLFIVSAFMLLLRRTVRRRTLELDRSREKLAITLHSIGDGVITTDTRGLVTDLNPISEALTGWRRDEAIGQPLTAVFRIINGLTRQLAENPVERVMATGKVVGLANHTLLISKNGTERQIADSGAPIFNSRGTIEGVVLVYRDVSSEYRMQEKVRDSEEKFRSIVEASPMGMHLYRLEPGNRLVFIGANPAADAILGVDNRQYIGKTIGEAFPANEPNGVADRYREICRSGVSWSTEWITYEDERVRGAFEVYAFRTGPDTMAAIFLDITQRKEDERHLVQSEERYRSVVAAMAEGVVVHGPDGKITTCNPTAVRILGLNSEDELLGRVNLDPRWRLLHSNGEPLAPEEQPALATLKSGVPGRDVVLIVELPGGARRWISVNTEPLFEKGSPSPTAVVATFTDLTDRLEAERAERSMREQLVQSERLSAVGQLAAGVAHEFNNILTVIRLAARKPAHPGEPLPPERMERVFDTVQEQTRRGAELVANLMAFARPKPPRKVRCQAEAIVNSVLKLQEGPLGLENIRVVRAFSGLPEIAADVGQLEQVLLNLVINARHAMKPRGGGTLTVRTWAEGERVFLQVADDGIGMNDETRTKLFTPFFTTKGAFAGDHLAIQGTGLGLSVSYRSIQEHGGEITVESTEGKGAAFTVSLPVGADVSAPFPGPPSPREEHERSSSMRILVVDDEKSLGDSLAELLVAQGHRAVAVESGSQAIRRMQEEPFEVVLLDLLLPDMKGERIHQELSALRPGLKTIFLSGRIDLDEAALKAKGAFGVLAKPFELDALFALLSRAKAP
ncbi:MAG: PAS domain S-box protein [Spirochaetes bacterium]|nr:PAS domain S-box protein [Spirochaetota bacterium]